MPRLYAAGAVLAGLIMLSTGVKGAAQTPGGAAPGEGIAVRSLLPVKPLSRAQRPAGVAAVVENAGETAVRVEAELVLPAGVSLVSGHPVAPLAIDDVDSAEARWDVTADTAGTYDLAVRVRRDGTEVASAKLAMEFIAPLEMRKLAYIPDPEPVKTDVLIGAHNCPLWEADRPHMWDQILKHPERTPALGFYSQESPEVADWETKWA